MKRLIDTFANLGIILHATMFNRVKYLFCRNIKFIYGHFIDMGYLASVQMSKVSAFQDSSEMKMNRIKMSISIVSIHVCMCTCSLL